MTASGERNAYVDWLRASSLIIVVVWHWAFTILQWHDDGPHATSPLGFTSGFWLLTWLFQVMPLFFYVGGFAHLRSWERARQRGVSLRAFVVRRLRRLTVPAAALLVVWLVIGAVAQAYFGWPGMGRVVLLVVSPLWFLAVYLMLIALLPAALWLHREYGQLVLVWLAGAAMCVDVLRFRYGYDGVAWLNMVLVWGLAHQAGFFYRSVVDSPRRTAWSLLWGGLFGLVGLVASGLYPGSMVGVPGEKFSNMAPPTFVIVALLVFQVGFVELVRPAMERVLARPRWRIANEVINRFALPLFLFHTTGMAISLFILWLLGWYRPEQTPNVTVMYWVTRPFALVGPLLGTLPVIWLFGRRWARGARSGAAEAVASQARGPAG